jgi:hypothetical protein
MSVSKTDPLRLIGLILDEENGPAPLGEIIREAGRLQRALNEEPPTPSNPHIADAAAALARAQERGPVSPTEGKGLLDRAAVHAAVGIATELEALRRLFQPQDGRDAVVGVEGFVTTAPGP